MLATAAFITGCSVKGGSVASNPPKTEVDMSQFGFTVTKGRLKSEIVSALMWPTKWSEKDFEIKVGKINKASKAMNDENIENVLRKRSRIRTLWYQFLDEKCVSETLLKDLTEDEKFTLDEMIWSDDRWVEVQAAEPNKPGYELYMKAQLCRTNQDQRVKLDSEISEFQSKMDEDGSKIKEAKKLISEELGDENSITLNQQGFSFELGANGENLIRVRDFNQSGITQRSDGGEFPIKDVTVVKNRVWFTIPGVGPNAGKEYRFELERVKNLDSSFKRTRGDNGEIRQLFVDLALFKGDFKLIEYGAVVRKGAAQVLGFMEEN